MSFGLYKADSKDWLVFILGLFTMLKVRLLGTFGISEIIMIPLFVVTAKNNPFFKNKKAVRLFTFAILWAFSTALTDLLRESTLEDSAKGLVSIIFLILILPVAYWALYDRPQRVAYYLAGLAISSILGFEFQDSIDLNESDADVWQVYAFEYLAVFIAGLCFYRNRKALGYAALIGYGVWALYHSSRNVFLLFLTASILIFLVYHFNKHQISSTQSQIRFNKHFLIIASVLLIGFIGVTNTYEHLASTGALGQAAKVKYDLQKNSAIGLASGRADFFIALKMIEESPIIGYGSYAKDKHELAYQETKELGLKTKGLYLQHKIRNKFIPGHSYILGAWVYNGILSLPFWIYSIILIAQYFKKNLYSDLRITPIMIVWNLIMLWNIFFSPFANRPVIAMLLAALLAIQSQLTIKSNKTSVYSYNV